MARLSFRAIKKRERNKLIVELIDKLLAYGRIINGVALAEGLMKGAIKEMRIVEELFNFQRDFDIASSKLTSDIVSELYPSDPCASDGKPCENLEVIGEGAEKMAKIGEKLKPNYGEILVDGGVLDSYLRLNFLYHLFGRKKMNANELILKLRNRNVTTDDEKDSLMSGIKTFTGELQKIKKLCDDKLQKIDIESLTQEKYLIEVEKILGFGDIGAFLKKESVEPLKEKLTSILKLAKELKPKLSKENLSTMKRNLKQLFHVVNSPRLPAEEKSLTSAFHSGYFDFARLTKDVEDLFEYNIGLNGSSKQKLKELFSSLVTLNKNMEPVAKALQNNQSMAGVEENVIKDFEDAEKEIEMIGKTQTVLDCVENMSGVNVGQGIEDWKKESGAKIGSDAQDYLKEIRKKPIEVSMFVDFLESIKNNDNLVAYANLQNSKEVDNVIKELQELITTLENLEKMPISAWMKQTDLPNLIEKSKKWLSDEKFLSGLSCTKNKTILDPVIKNFAKRAQLFAVSMLNAKNQHDAKLKVAANTLRSVTKEYESLLNKIKTRKVRSAERIPTLEEGLKICQNLSAALKIYRDLIYAYASNKDIQELLKIDAQIESKIAQLTDPEQKKKVKSLWNEETKKTLASIPGIIDQLSKKITAIPKTLTEFGDILKSPVNLESLKPVDLVNLIDNIQSMDPNLMDQGVADRLRTVQMDFANGRSKMEHGLAAFLLSVPWFNILTAPSPAVSDKGSTSKNEGLSLTTMIVIGIVGLIAFLLVALYLQGVCEISKEETDEENSEDKPKEKSKVKSEEKSEDNSKEKSKVKSEEKSTETSGEKKKKKRKRIIRGRHFQKGFGRLGHRLTCGAFRKKKEETVPSPVPPPVEETKPQETTEVPRIPNSEKTKIFQKEDGEYYVKPVANYSETLVTCIECDLDKKADKEVRIEDVPDKDTREKLALEVEKANKFGEEQNVLRAVYRRVPEEHRVVQFKCRSEENYEKISQFEYKTDLDESINVTALSFKPAEVIYYVGQKYDEFLKEGEKAVDKTEVSVKTIRTYTAEDEALLSKKNLRTATDIENELTKMHEASTKQLQKTQSDATIDQTQEGGHDDNQENRLTSGAETAPLLDKETEKKEDEDEPYPDKLFTEEFEGKKYVVNKVDVTWNPVLDELVENRYTPGKYKFIGVVGECYIDKYCKNKLDIEKKPTINKLLKFMMTEEVVHYDKTLEKRKERNEHLGVFHDDDLLKIVEKAKPLFMKDPDVLQLKRTKIRVIGDLHGCHDDMARHMELGMDDEESTYLFLGDYVDRGKWNLNVFLKICLLKLSNPNRYYFIRGNHEFPQVNISNKKERCLMEECVQTYGEERGRVVYKAICALLLEMPVAAITQGNIWNAHGGLSALMLKGREWLLANLKKKPTNPIQWQLLLDVLWSDPSENCPVKKNIHNWFPLPVKTRTKYNHEFTKEGQELIFKACGFVGMFRGHQAVYNGFEMFNSYQCVTVFGACNNNKDSFGCQAVVHKTGTVEFILFYCDDRKNKDEDCKTDARSTEEEPNDNAKKNTPKPTNESKEQSKTKSRPSGTTTSKNGKSKTPTTGRSKPVAITKKETSKGKNNSNTPAKKK